VAERISKERRMDEKASAVLGALLDTLVPASDDGRLPSASKVDFLGHLERFDAEYVPTLFGTLSAFDDAFASLALSARVPVVAQFAKTDPAAFWQLLQRVYDCYYQDPRVRVAIGAAVGAPFPQGNTLLAGDLSLLDPVIRNREKFRHRRV
jgi:hypothetical protein